MTVLSPGRFDYEFMGDTLAELEERYSYNKEAAREVITHEMEAQGAALGDDGFWHYNGEPVKLLFVIRNDDPDQARLHLGNYIADELESIGFKVQRIYEDSYGAMALCFERDPWEGGWHLCTAGWAGRDMSFMGLRIAEYYTSFSRPEVLFSFYEPPDELLGLALMLAYNDFRSPEERRDVFARALELSLEDSVRIWLVVKYQ